MLYYVSDIHANIWTIYRFRKLTRFYTQSFTDHGHPHRCSLLKGIFYFRNVFSFFWEFLLRPKIKYNLRPTMFIYQLVLLKVKLSRSYFAVSHISYLSVQFEVLMFKISDVKFLVTTLQKNLYVQDV